MASTDHKYTLSMTKPRHIQGSF